MSPTCAWRSGGHGGSSGATPGRSTFRSRVPIYAGRFGWQWFPRRRAEAWIRRYPPRFGRRAADVLANAGYEMVETCPPRYEEAIAVWAQFIMGDFASVLGRLVPMMGKDGVTFLNALTAAVPAPTDTASMSALFAQRDGVARAWSTFMSDHPLILSPPGRNFRSSMASTPPARRQRWRRWS